MGSANVMSFGAEWARRNLEEDGQAATSAHQGWTDPMPAMPAIGWTDAMQAYMATAATAMSGAGEIDTIAVFGAQSNGMSKDKLRQWFDQRPGFVTLQVNKKLDGTFVKFASQAHADQALKDAHGASINAEWAR